MVSVRFVFKNAFEKEFVPYKLTDYAKYYITFIQRGLESQNAFAFFSTPPMQKAKTKQKSYSLKVVWAVLFRAPLLLED